MAILKKVNLGRINSIGIYIGGGSLIHPSIVLSTAHNMNNSDANELIVRAGEYNTQSTDEFLKHVEQDVESIVYHPKFTRSNLFNDLAILFLKKPFKLAPHINTICLPKAQYVPDNSKCVTGGWGKEFFGNKANYQAFLKKVELPVIANEECQEMLQKTRLGEDFELHYGFMCAGELKFS
jgi:plasma kallikrein